MTIVPVIMCGGSGVRLWPASRPSRPKQFIPLVGAHSTFQQTVLRVRGIAGATNPLIVAGRRHQSMLVDQLAAIGAQANLLFEPVARDSAPAMAAAAVWSLRRDPDAVLVILASDHYIPDVEAFQRAVAQAAEAAGQGVIVTLGVQPTEPATAYGYVKPAPGDDAVRRVDSFVEKPSREVAERYLATGYLWNSGNFIVRADRLLAELKEFAPGIVDAVEAAVDGMTSDGALGPTFAEAAKISIDYAVMEKTRHAAVLPVDFAWSDLGAWDAIRTVSPKDMNGNVLSGDVYQSGVSNSLVRAQGVTVAVVGVQNLAVVAEPGAVLVCALDAAQGVRPAVDELTLRGAVGADVAAPEDIHAAASRLKRWLYTQALPLWFSLGVSADGSFAEAISHDAAAILQPRRARVQLRQAFVYACAERAGWGGQGMTAARAALAAFDDRFRRPDGLFRTQCDRNGAVVDDSVWIYDHAFALLAWSATADEDKALALLESLQTRRAPAGGFIEHGDQPYQSNPHMHLFEAALAWIEAGGGPAWRTLAAEIANLALSHFIDRDGGFIREFFDADWQPASDQIEPGHQFEWAWLLLRWARLSGETGAARVAERLYAAGQAGFDPARGVTIDAISSTFRVLEPRARLWPQTEWLKAALIFDDPKQALHAARALSSYLQTEIPGLWWDKMATDGSFLTEPAPASSLYHIAVAIESLADWSARQNPD